MSMAGYVIGLGDRHPSNLMIQRQSGHVVHIDFGDSFEVALNRDRMPEKVPFRLSRMIVNAFGVSGVEGQFRTNCEQIMRILRENKSSIIAQLEIFVHEPIFVNKYSGECSEGSKRILERILMKLSGKDPVEGNVEELDVERQVSLLIQIAGDPYKYVNHYIGWCQFW
jgi:phosphatidylinositol kinase/protein kinase (PI-3  family)